MQLIRIQQQGFQCPLLHIKWIACVTHSLAVIRLFGCYYLRKDDDWDLLQMCMTDVHRLSGWINHCELLLITTAAALSETAAHLSEHDTKNDCTNDHIRSVSRVVRHLLKYF